MERKVFERSIVESARFLKMPASTQALYFHLGLDSGDDGMVDARGVMRLIGTSEDDLRRLEKAGLVTVPDENWMVRVFGVGSCTETDEEG